MDSPPEFYRLRDFIKIADFLFRKNIRVPKIHSADEENGLLLLEDFGKEKYPDYLKGLDEKSLEGIYRIFVDLVIKIQSLEPDIELPIYDKEAYLKELEIYLEFYPKFYGIKLPESALKDFFSLWSEALDKLPDFGEVFVHRDYHIENAMKLPGEGIESIGLLDFQDAKIGHRLYDIVSILEDARRAVDISFARKILDYYLDRVKIEDKEKAYLGYSILGAQRNSRIMGVFCRKYIRDGSDSYLKYLPLVSKYLIRDLGEIGLGDLKTFYSDLLKVRFDG